MAFAHTHSKEYNDDELKAMATFTIGMLESNQDVLAFRLIFTISSVLNITPEEVVTKIRQFSQMDVVEV